LLWKITFRQLFRNLFVTFLFQPTCNYYVLYISCYLSAFQENPEALAPLSPAVSWDDVAVTAAEHTKEEKKKEGEEHNNNIIMSFELF